MTTQRINMTKYGFIRSPEDDFTDDGAKFTCYRVGNVRVSKASYKTEIFISARRDTGMLRWEEYSVLPRYKDLNKLNGVSSITDQDLKELYEACVEYDQAYEAAQNQLHLPTAEEITRYTVQVHNLRQKEYYEVKTLLANNISTLLINLPTYKFDTLQKRFKDLYQNIKSDPYETSKQLFNSLTKGSYVRDHLINKYDLNPSYEYKDIIELIDKYK